MFYFGRVGNGAYNLENASKAEIAIVEVACGKVTRYEDNKSFHYNREELLNGWFLVERS